MSNWQWNTHHSYHCDLHCPLNSLEKKALCVNIDIKLTVFSRIAFDHCSTILFVQHLKQNIRKHTVIGIVQLRCSVSVSCQYQSIIPSKSQPHTLCSTSKTEHTKTHSYRNSRVVLYLVYTVRYRYCINTNIPYHRISQNNEHFSVKNKNSIEVSIC